MEAALLLSKHAHSCAAGMHILSRKPKTEYLTTTLAHAPARWLMSKKKKKINFLSRPHKPWLFRFTRVGKASFCEFINTKWAVLGMAVHRNSCGLFWLGVEDFVQCTEVYLSAFISAGPFLPASPVTPRRPCCDT